MNEFSFSILHPGDRSRALLLSRIYAEKRRLVKEKCRDVSSILEIGVRAGYSAFTFLQAFPHASYIGIDANNGTHGGQGGQDGSYMEWAKKILPDDVILLEMDTQEVDRLAFERRFDLIHVDGNHSADGVVHDLEICFPFLRHTPEARILIDDYNYISGVRRGVDYWVTHRNGSVGHEVIDTIRGDVLIWRANGEGKCAKS